MTKKQNPANALVTVISVLEPLADAEKQWVLNSAASRWTLSVQPLNVGGRGATGVGSQVGGGADTSGGSQHSAEAALSKRDVRAFIRIKRPTSDMQRVACLGYFHSRTTDQQGFTSKDIQKLHTDSGGSKFNLSRALDNATRRAKYISSRSQREKQLTTLGEDVVEALPDRVAVAALEEATRHRRKGGTTRKARKKKA